MLLNSQTVLDPQINNQDTGCLIIFEQYLSGENPRQGLLPPFLRFVEIAIRTYQIKNSIP